MPCVILLLKLFRTWVLPPSEEESQVFLGIRCCSVYFLTFWASSFFSVSARLRGAVRAALGESIPHVLQNLRGGSDGTRVGGPSFSSGFA